MDWSTLTEHWTWLPGPSLLLAVSGWLARRKGVHPWQALVSQFNLNREIATCKQDLASCEASRANEQRGREYATVALKEMIAAASQVKEAAEAGRLTSSSPSPSGRSRSRTTSTGSRRRPRRGPLDLL
jgi:hypothetical protein